jgi:hypothetical protein
LRGNGDYFCPLDLIAAIEALAIVGRCAYPDAMRARIEGGLVQHDRSTPDQREVLLDARAVASLPEGIVVGLLDQPQVLVQRLVSQHGARNLACCAVITELLGSTGRGCIDRTWNGRIGHDIYGVTEERLPENSGQGSVFDEPSQRGARKCGFGGRGVSIARRDHQAANAQKQYGRTDRESRRTARVRALRQGSSPLKVRSSFGSWPLQQL